MQDYKIIIIDKDGNVIPRGIINTSDLHIVELLDYAKEKYPNRPIFKQLNYLHSPYTAVYFLNLENNIVILNITKYGKKQLDLIMPDFSLINDIQEQRLIDILTEFCEYKLNICYNSIFKNGIVESENILGYNEETSIETYRRMQNLTNYQNRLKR